MSSASSLELLSVPYVTGFDEEGAADTVGERVLSKPFGPRDLLRARAEF